MNNNIKFSTIQNTADQSSLNGQNNYLKLIKIQLVVLFLTTLTSVFFSYWSNLLIIVLLLMIGSFIITTILKIRKPERTWYDGRAVAESVKTLTWRFMMRAEPFNNLDTDDKTLFINTIKKILMEQNNYHVSDDVSNSEIITNDMLEIRTFTVEERRNIYIIERIKNQRAWYSRKSKYNKDCESRLFYFSIIVQFLAIAYLILMLAFNSISFNLTAILTSLVTISMTWLQLKQHYELAQSYGLAANELILIESLGTEIKEEKILSEYVNDSENAISREHTMWIARKGQYSEINY